MGYLLKNKCTNGFFCMPQWLYDGGIIKRLSFSARAVLELFYRVLNRTDSPRFTITQRVIGRETGLTPKTIRAACLELEKIPLIHSFKPEIGGAPYIFTLLNPETKQPFPDDGRSPAIYDPDKRERMRAGLKRNEDARPRAIHAAIKRRTRVVEPCVVQESQPHHSPTAPVESTPVRKRVCSTHPNGEVWYLPDGTARCGICHPNPNKQAPVTNELTGDEIFLKK